ncbi:hypothetical protein pb186bvf_017964 [Paramecium bursaria]
MKIIISLIIKNSFLKCYSLSEFIRIYQIFLIITFMQNIKQIQSLLVLILLQVVTSNQIDILKSNATRVIEVVCGIKEIEQNRSNCLYINFNDHIYHNEKYPEIMLNLI